MTPDIIRRFYEKRATEYGSTDPEGKRRYEIALELAAFPNGTGLAVLDVGCKKSLLPALLSDHGLRSKYIGVDISPTVLASSENPESFRICADVTAGLPFPDRVFSHVFCLELLEHVVSPFVVLAELSRVLRQGGELILSVPNPYYWAEIYGNLRRVPETEGHIASFTWQNLDRLLGFAGFIVARRRGTYLRAPFLDRLFPRWNLIAMKPWILARSVVYLAKKRQGTPESARGGAGSLAQ